MKSLTGKLSIAMVVLLIVGLAIGYSLLLWPGDAPVSGLRAKGLAIQESPTVKVVVKDMTDALLLNDSKQQQTYDFGFRRVVAYYGLSLKELDLASQPLTDALLRDEAGTYYRTIFISGANFDSFLDDAGIKLLKTAMDDGANVMIAGVQTQESLGLQTLTNGEITGSTNPADPTIDYRVSNVWPEVTKEFSGIEITGDSQQVDYALTISSHTPDCQSLVTSTDGSGRVYTVLAICTKGAGHLLVDSAIPDGALQYSPLASSYYAVNQPDMVLKAQRFAQIVPLMMFVRYSAGDAAWHQNHHYANLTLDDPSLKVGRFNYAGILKEAMDHNFHMTIAMPPAAYTATEQSVVDLFLEHPERLSIVQHGNNHNGYEFYNYATDPANAADPNTPSPLWEQEANVVEGLTRMEAFKHATGIPFARAMIFPFNISPADTLVLLKEYNFQATINSRDYPLDVQRSTTWDSYMYQAELAYNNLAVMGRTGPRTAPYPFSLFIGQPILLYVHKDFFGKSMGAFDSIADHINSLQGKVEWQSLDYILKRLYLERTTHDGTVDVMFYGNDLIVTNESSNENEYHLKRNEAKNVPISGVVLDGKPVEYSIRDSTLEVDTVIPAGASRELIIRYAPPGRDFAIGPGDVTIDTTTLVVTATIHNNGTQPGPVSVGFFKGMPQDGTLLALATARRIEAGASTVVTTTLASLPPGDITVAVDPYDVVPETDETNNVVTESVQVDNRPSPPAGEKALPPTQPPTPALNEPQP